MKCYIGIHALVDYSVCVNIYQHSAMVAGVPLPVPPHICTHSNMVPVPPTATNLHGPPCTSEAPTPHEQFVTMELVARLYDAH
jgi:hypothetical protein